MESLTLSNKEYREILALKRDLHMHPELSGKEFRTTGIIKEKLSEIDGVEILDTGTETGVLARIAGSGSERCPDKATGRQRSTSVSEGRDGRAADLKGVDERPAGSSREDGGEDAFSEIMLRADIDALPQTETFESRWKSVNPGVMHACGHDFHTASLVGAAMILSRAKAAGELKNTVDLVFQPAEEGTTGARTLIDAGLFEKIHPDLCFGIHNWPSVPAGRIVCHEGALMSAKRNFTVTILGSGGHGSMPHLNVDPIVCAATVIGSLQTVVSRNTNPLDSVILSINMIEGGSPVNLVVNEVRMMATIRSLSEQALDRAIERTISIIENTAAAYECRSKIEWKERIPAVYNTREMTEAARRCAERTWDSLQSIDSYLSGGEILDYHEMVTDAPPSLASEDFALYRTYVPSFFYWVGSHTEGEPVEELHRPGFHTDDAALRTAAALYAASAMC